MPALVNTDKVITTEMAESTLKQCITVVEKKVRNLEKRKAKLDSYQVKQTEGAELNKDQKEAMAKYEVVMQNLDFARDLQKQFQMMLAESEKILRKQTKREKVERQQLETGRLQVLLKSRTVLSGFLKSQVKSDFLTGNNGALVLSPEVVEQLIELERLTNHRDDLFDLRQVDEASEHIVAFLDGKETPVIGTTYSVLKETVQSIIDCGYFSKPLNFLCCKTDIKEDNALPSTDNAQDEDAALSTSGSPSPLSSNSSAASNADVNADSPHLIESLVTELPVADPEPLDSEPAKINGHFETIQVTEEANVVQEDNVNPVEPFTFETSEVGGPYVAKKDARDIVSAFDGHFNFLQESLIDEDWSFSNSQAPPTSVPTYMGPAIAFSTCHTVFPTPVVTYAATADSFVHNYVSNIPEEGFDAAVSSQQPIVTYANQFGVPHMTTMPYITPMMNDAYFAHHNANYAQQVAFTTAYGPVMQGYTTEPIMTESHLDTDTCIYHVNEDAVNTAQEDSGFQPINETHFNAENTISTNDDDTFSDSNNKMELSGLNPNASEFHSRFTPPLVDFVSNEEFAVNEEETATESSEQPEMSGEFHEVTKGSYNEFRGRGHVYRGRSRGGRYNSNRGGYNPRYRNNYHRDGYNGDYNNGSSWRGGYNRGGRGRGMNNSRGRGFVRNDAVNHEVEPSEERVSDQQ